ncbi:MAG TPA: ATP-binding cassette domain-containing protein [Telmatospirillum sp.]|nr:ATP-binding cassette domain-containing protein [Telmatospirillum sp.]
MTTIVLEARDLTYAYPGGVAALSNLDLAVAKGRRLAILGPNGAGKTTLLLHLNGTLRPTSGHVLLEGRQTGYGRAALSAWRRQVGLVLQDADDQLFAASVAEDVSFGPLNLGLDDATARIRVEDALAALDLTDLGERPTHMLSFGQKKRVALAGAVAMAPDILLLDEPTAGLDHLGTRHLLAVLERLNQGGTTLVFSTHDVDLAYAFADDVALFDNGRVLAQGPAPDILADSNLLAKAQLRAPFLLEMGLKTKSLGLLGANAPLPRRPQDMLALLDRIAAQMDSGTVRPG